MRIKARVYHEIGGAHRLVVGHTPDKFVATSILQRYSIVFRLPVEQADVVPTTPVSFR